MILDAGRVSSTMRPRALAESATPKISRTISTFPSPSRFEVLHVSASAAGTRRARETIGGHAFRLRSSIFGGQVALPYDANRIARYSAFPLSWPGQSPIRRIMMRIEEEYFGAGWIKVWMV